MSFIGTVKHGVIELPPEARLAEGQRVEIVPASLAPEEAFVLRETAADTPPVCDLPDDLASNLDYYLHSHDHKQQPRRGRWISAAKPTSELTERQAAEFANKLLELAAQTNYLPPDLSANHDHYLHGLPRR
ncbi:MAG: hypothetical protein MUF81_17215 [Verrucomicrobia bacterium]|nr:hypothetical protein [Verrucomicrobiota bacterium]